MLRRMEGEEEQQWDSPRIKWLLEGQNICWGLIPGTKPSSTQLSERWKTLVLKSHLSAAPPSHRSECLPCVYKAQAHFLYGTCTTSSVTSLLPLLWLTNRHQIPGPTPSGWYLLKGWEKGSSGQKIPFLAVWLELEKGTSKDTPEHGLPMARWWETPVRAVNFRFFFSDWPLCAANW